jgi:glycosyltransferase involved in cell wall biosynthesis
MHGGVELMGRVEAVEFSILIATFNRARVLRGTLQNLAALRPQGSWEVIVVDNNSSDDTRQVVDAAARIFPVELRYVFEREPGRSAALNAGFQAARGEFLVTTDDDVRVDPGWLDRIAAGFAAHGCDYIGGRVLPVWPGQRPDWLPARNEVLCGVLAVMDYGPSPIRYGARVPLGVNMAIRREALRRAGHFDCRVGRKAGTLLGQEVREWCVRAHAAGLVGYYVPDVVVHHLIPQDRLTKNYFRRWYYWRGVSRAILYADCGLDMENPEGPPPDVVRIRHIAGVPRYMFRTALVRLKDAAAAWLAGDAVTSFDRELWLCFFAGIVGRRWRDRHVAVPIPSHRVAPVTTPQNA